ncbi:MAG: TonB-dependent receptor domain-containing protein [Pyrinomonadaceae bacterium]
MKKLLIGILFVLGSLSIVLAQTPTGRLLGVVSSPDGGVLPNATVEVKFNQTSKSQTITTDGDGAFSIPQLEPGEYTVTVTASGFKTFVANQVKIDIGRDYNLLPVLEVGSVQETVTVTAGADVITSTSAQVTNVVSPQQILSLPLITRNPLNLTTLQAGTASNPNQGTSINGMRTTLTNITRDGISINDAFIRANATDFAPGRPSVDDTGEFTISTTNQEADLGSGGAQIILVTPRGTKSFHGALFAYNRNSEFAANDFFNNRDGRFVATDAAVIQGRSKVGDLRSPRPFRNRNQYGGKVGGPFPVPHFGEGGPVFEKNKGFFFFAYEKVNDPRSARATRTILTPSARSGTFTFNRATAGSPITSGQIICPSGDAGSVCTVPNILAFAQAQGFAGIPSTTDPLIQSRILSRIPAQGNTTGGDSLNTTGFSLNRRQDTLVDTYTTRIDVDATEKDSVSGVFSYNFENNFRPDVDPMGFDVTPDATQSSKNKTLSLTYRRIFSSNIVNEARYGIFTSEVPFNRVSQRPSFFLGFASTTNIDLLAGIISNPDNIFLDQGRNNKTFTWADNVNWIVGKHSLKFGGQYQKYKINSFNDVFTIPNYVIGTTTSTTLGTNNFANVGGTAGSSLINSNQLGTANGLLALLGGLVSSATQGFNTTSPTSGFQTARNLSPFRNTNSALYVSDRWSVSRGLTISLGLRYELYPALKLANGLSVEPVISDPDNPAASLLTGNGTFNVLGTNAGKEFLYYKTDYNNFAPSFGIAYTPNLESGIGKFFLGGEGRTVIRGGYSQIYGNDSIITSLNGTLVSNVGLGRATNSAIGPTGTTSLNDRISGGLTPIAPPPFTPLPRSFLQNNTAGQGFFGQANAVDPKLQIPLVEQYSAGVQREFFGNTAFEIRYVGTRSKNLARGIDLNQIDVINNGFLTEFQKAQANLALTGTTAFCNPVTVTGCQALSLFRTGSGATQIGTGPLLVGTNLSITQFNADLRNGVVADLAQRFVGFNLNNHPTLASPGNVPFVKFYQNPNIGQIELFTNAGSYNYNSLQLEIRRRFSQGVYFQANYTFSKNLTNTVGTSQGLFEPFLQNQNQDLDNQRADFDQTHVFNFNGIFQLPFGKGKTFLNNGGIVDKIFGGFELSGLLQTATGSPISFIDSRGTLNRGARSGRQTPFSSLTNDQIRALSGVFEANGRIYFIDPSIIGSNGAGSPGFINPSNANVAFPGQVFFNVAPGQTGNVARTLINGPRQFNVNLALLKNIRFTESIRVQLRAEAFNAFNNVSFFSTQFANINSATFGQLTSTSNPARQMQFAARFEF